MHFHMLLLDGVFVADGDSARWVRVPPPTTEEVQQLVTHIARRVERWLDTQGYGADEPCQEDVDDDANGVLLSASVAGRVALGVRAGAKVRRLQRVRARPFRLPRLCAEDRGYNLHAAVVIRHGDREGLERLCRYVLRPPLARTRLHRRPDGLLVLTLRKPYANGTTDFIFSEVELAQKLAALVPPNRKNGVSYHGVLAPRHRHRNHVIPEPPQAEPRERLTKTPAKGKSRWHGWADLLWRVFEDLGRSGLRTRLRLRRSPYPSRCCSPTRYARRAQQPGALRATQGARAAVAQTRLRLSRTASAALVCRPACTSDYATTPTHHTTEQTALPGGGPGGPRWRRWRSGPERQPETTESLYAGLGDALMLLILPLLLKSRHVHWRAMRSRRGKRPARLQSDTQGSL